MRHFYDILKFLTINIGAVPASVPKLMVQTVCLIESGKQPEKNLINEKMRSFLTKKSQNRDMDDPFQITYEICEDAKSIGFKFLQR